MLKLRAPVLVGIVAFAGILAFIYFFGAVEDRVVSKGEGYTVFAIFDDVTGLAPHSRVTSAGIPVGTIEKIALVETKSGVKARIDVLIRRDLKLYQGIKEENKKVYRNGATIIRKAASVLGDYFLEISPGLEGRLLGEGDQILNVVGESGIGAVLNKLDEVSELFPKINRIADDVSNITASLSEVVGGPEGRAKLQLIADDVSSSANDIAQMTGKVKNFINRELDTKSSQFDRIVNNFEVFSRNAAVISDASGKALIHTLKNLEYITDEVKKYIGEGEGPDRQKVEGLKDAIRKINTTLNELQKTTENFREITEKINKGEGTLGKLVNDDKLIKKTEEMVTETGNLIKTITRLETQIGFRSEFNYHERAIKNYFELKLQPNPNKYYLIGLTFDPRGKTKIIERVTLSNDPSVPPALTERVTETTMDLKFSLEFAYRWYFLTGRFGVIESTGGIGLDGEFLKDSMKFSFDLFDFDSDKYPRLKWLWTFEFIKHFFIAAGIDDILNKMGRDYFAGAGVRFTDDDLKALLIASPSIKY